MEEHIQTLKDFPGVEWIKGSGDFIKIDTKKCSGCEDCVKGCLAECFEMAGSIAGVKTLDGCLECGYCWFICPEDAIEFSLPPSGTGFRSEWG